MRSVKRTRPTALRNAPGIPIFNDAESPLVWLRRRKDKNGSALITSAQFEAGERLRADYERAQIAPGVTMRWEPVRLRGIGGVRLAPTERQLSRLGR